jgi:hypothetical protein
MPTLAKIFRDLNKTMSDFDGSNRGELLPEEMQKIKGYLSDLDNIIATQPQDKDDASALKTTVEKFLQSIEAEKKKVEKAATEKSIDLVFNVLEEVRKTAKTFQQFNPRATEAELLTDPFVETIINKAIAIKVGKSAVEAIAKQAAAEVKSKLVTTAYHSAPAQLESAAAAASAAAAKPPVAATIPTSKGRQTLTFEEDRLKGIGSHRLRAQEQPQISKKDTNPSDKGKPKPK